MKADEIIFRQNRVVYTLMILLASIGLVWSFWQHQQDTAIPELAPQTTTASPTTATGTTPR